ncbi:hypothetical protein SCALM49S_02008 [Streptomyces californicus]
MRGEGAVALAEPGEEGDASAVVAVEGGDVPRAVAVEVTGDALLCSAQKLPLGDSQARLGAAKPPSGPARKARIPSLPSL